LRAIITLLLLLLLHKHKHTKINTQTHTHTHTQGKNVAQKKRNKQKQSKKMNNRPFPDFQNINKQLSKIVQTVRGGGGRGSPNARIAMAGSLLALSAVTLGIGAYKCLYKVEGGQSAVKFNRLVGVLSDVYEEGYHFRWPLLERAIIYDIRNRPSEISSLTGSKDLQMVNLTVRILHRPNKNKLPEIYRSLGLNYAEKVLPSIGHEVMKAVVARYTAAELLTQRSKVSETIQREIETRAAAFNIVIENVSITQTGFSKEYSAAVEAKQVAEQESERARFFVDKALQEKEAAIIQAQGEAKSIELVGEAMKKDKGFLELRRIEAAKEIAEALSDPRASQNKIYLNSENLLLNLGNMMSPSTNDSQK